MIPTRSHPRPRSVSVVLAGLWFLVALPGTRDPAAGPVGSQAGAPAATRGDRPDGLAEEFATLALGSWYAWLDSPGGILPFWMDLAVDVRAGKLRTTIVNGEERIPLPGFLQEDRGDLVFDFPHYDATIRAKASSTGTRLDGEWRKRTGAERWARLPFHAVAGERPDFRDRDASAGSSPDADTGKKPRIGESGAPPELAPVWSVTFSESDDPAVARFWRTDEGEWMGTFLTTTGDHRFLAGEFHDRHLRLSCFDGAHAFLFLATLRDDGTLVGDFWSRDTWHETWTARPDPDATLPDAFAATAWNDSIPLGDLVFPDLEGRPRALDDPAFAGRVRLLQLFGTWCPNCNDQTRFLVELHDRYAGRGLSILGLAFEVTGDFERDAEQVRRHRRHLGVRYPVLVAGLSDKEEASRAFPALDRLRAYPTTVFLDRNGRVRAVHTGWSGPATGSAHDRVRQRFVALVEELLAEGEAEQE